MRVKIKGPQALGGETKAPGSKAYTHRALLASLLSQGESIIQGALDCDDTHRTLNGIEALGANVRIDKQRIISVGVKEISRTDISIDCGESGASFRFLTAIAATSPLAISLRATKTLADRPLDPLLKSMKELGASTITKYYDQGLELQIKGPLKGGETSIQGNISSQFISGLLFAAPHAKTDVTIHVNGRLESRPYVEMSIDILGKHGISIEQYENVYHVPAPQEYTPASHQVPGDFSSAAFLIAGAGITGDEITITGLNNYKLEPDSVILKLVDEMGIEAHTKGDAITIRKNKLQGFRFDASNNPDLIPPLQVLGSFAEGDSEIKGVERLRYKETNRLQTVPDELKKMGAKITMNNDTMKIEGTRGLAGSNLDSKGDHRVAMACGIASLGAKGVSVLHRAEAVSKSYPEFFKDLARLGVQLDVE